MDSVRTRALPLLLIAVCAGLSAQTLDQVLAESEGYRARGQPAEALAVLDRALRQYPNSPLLLFNRGATLGELERYEEAVAALRSGLALDSGHPEARLTLAKVLVSSHRYQAALAEVDRYSAGATGAPQCFDCRYIRGLALRRLDRNDEAERELRIAVEIDPGHADALFNLGAVLADRGMTEESISVLGKAAGLRPDNPDIRYRLAQALRQAGDSERASAELARFDELREAAQRESRVAVLLREARKSMERADPEGAKGLYQQVIRQDPGNVEAHTNLGIAYERLGRGDLAEAMFRKTVQIRPDHAEAHLNLGLKLAEKGAFPQALERISEAVRLAPEHVAARQGLGMVLTRLDRPAEALPHFEFVAGRRPASAEAHLNLGIAQAEGGFKAEALQSFQEARRLEPESHLPRYFAGRVLADLGRTQEARAELERAVELGERHAPAVQLLGNLERAAGNADRAVDLLRRAAALDPQNALAHYDLGLALAQAGSAEDAIPHWERALALDPQHTEAIYNLAQALQATEPRKAREYMSRFAAMKAERLDTDRAGTLWNFALAEARQERWERAFDLFRQALDACGECPAKGQIHKNLGLTYGHAGDFARAEGELLKAWRLLPGDTEIEQALRVVRQSAAAGK